VGVRGGHADDSTKEQVGPGLLDARSNKNTKCVSRMFKLSLATGLAELSRLTLTFVTQNEEHVFSNNEGTL
jgi:hypothetical protein